LSAFQQADNGGLSGQEIPFNLQLPNLPMQVVNHRLRVGGLLVAALKQFLGVLHQLLFPSADHRRTNTVF
jgi:hypothetical protein